MICAYLRSEQLTQKRAMSGSPRCGFSWTGWEVKLAGTQKGRKHYSSVFKLSIEVEECGKCGGRMKVIVCIEEPEVIADVSDRSISKHLGLDEVATPHSRSPPQDASGIFDQTVTTLFYCCSRSGWRDLSHTRFGKCWITAGLHLGLCGFDVICSKSSEDFRYIAQETDEWKNTGILTVKQNGLFDLFSFPLPTEPWLFINHKHWHDIPNFIAHFFKSPSNSADEIYIFSPTSKYNFCFFSIIINNYRGRNIS